MTVAEFKCSLANPKPPAGLPPAVVALWWAGKDDWDKAHKLVHKAANWPVSDASTLSPGLSVFTRAASHPPVPDAV